MKKLIYVLVTSACSLLFFSFFPTDSMAATTYYVSSSGNDLGPGTSDAPWKTIQKAANTLVAGDTVIVSEGNYPERITISRSGTSAARIVFHANGTVNTRGFLLNGSYLSVDGFTTTSTYCDTGYQGAGFTLVGDYNIIENNYIYDNPQYGIVSSSDSQNAIIKNNIIRKNVMAGISISGENHLIQNNEISETVQKHSTGCTGDADGIHFFGSGHTFSQNYIHDIHFDGNLVTDAHIDCFQTWSDSYHASASNILIERNYCEAATYNDTDDHGTGMMIANANALVIKNNIFRSYRGLNEGGSGPNTNMQVLNNTFINSLSFPTHAYPMGMSFSSFNNGKIQNNIFYDFKGYIMNGSYSGASVQNNIAYKSDGTSPQISQCGAGCIIVNRGFVDVANYNYHLLASSVAIDAGFAVIGVSNDYDGSIRPVGQGFDIGAFEYQLVPDDPPVELRCKADYNLDSKIDSQDFSTFATNYKKDSIDCALDLIDGDCLLSLADFQKFARVYNHYELCELE